MDSEYEPGVDAVVVNYRTPRDLLRFLRSFRTAAGELDAGLTVVNVDPTPRDDEVAQNIARAMAEDFFAFPTNVGYARACNRGAARGNREVLALFNADIVLTDNAIARCYEALMANPTWGVLGPRQVNGENRFTHAGIFGTNAQPAHRGWRDVDAGQYLDVRQAVTVSGSAYFVRREVWDELHACPIYRELAPEAEGAFLPTQHYYEETWASYHARAHGWRVIYYGPVGIVHEWHRASEVGGPADAEMPRSREYFRRACAAHDIPCD